MQYGVKGKGNMNVQVKGSEREQTQTKPFACPDCLTILSVGSVSKSGCKHSSKQTYT